MSESPGRITSKNGLFKIIVISVSPSGEVKGILPQINHN